MILGAHLGEPGHASDVALEIDATNGYFWIDPTGIRGSGTKTDPPGRSIITADVRPGAASTTISITAKTPYKSPGGDGGSAEDLVDGHLPRPECGSPERSTARRDGPGSAAEPGRPPLIVPIDSQTEPRRRKICPDRFVLDHVVLAWVAICWDTDQPRLGTLRARTAAERAEADREKARDPAATR